jgi:hypothetical protein
VSELSEIALAFAKECMGWKNATIGISPFAGMIGNGHLPGSRCFNFVDLNAVMEAARAWCFGIKGYLEIKLYPETVRAWVTLDGTDIGCGKSDTDLCAALMQACLEAARKLAGAT